MWLAVNKASWKCACGLHWKLLVTVMPTANVVGGVQINTYEYELWHSGEIEIRYRLAESYDEWICMQYFLQEMSRYFDKRTKCGFVKVPGKGIEVLTW